MSHKNKVSLPQQVFDALDAKARYGHAKKDDRADGVADKYIYSYETMATYKKQALPFVAWAKKDEQIREDLGRSPRTLAEIRPYAERYLKEREAEGKSAYTLKTQRAALSKLYRERIEVELRGAKRSEITRSRGDAVRDKHFSTERNADLVTFCKCAGPRRAELARLSPSALVWKDGAPYIHFTKGTKGGRERISPLVGSPDEIRTALRYLDTLTGNNKIHSAADIHSYRAEYATRVYLAHARDLSTLKGQKVDVTALTGKTRADGSRVVRSAIYACRGDRRGDKMDRAAMIAASQALGHNRESVVGEHYIRI